MKPLYESVDFLDKRCVDEFGLSEDVMMEHAAQSIEQHIREKFPLNSSIQILCGPGNNGADGIALARMLYGDYNVCFYSPLGKKSPMAQTQYMRVQKVGVKEVDTLIEAECYVDALFGSGLKRELDKDICGLIKNINKKSAYKIACDVPCGIFLNGNIQKCAFKAHTTITMGALKTALFSDKAKDYVGYLHVSNLGVSRQLYETNTNTYLLEKKDMHLPIRKNQNSHKGNFGHLAVLSGEKKGAALLCAEAGFAFGAGLVSVVGNVKRVPHHIMVNKKLPKNASAIVCGMGLGEKKYENELKTTKLPMVLDADILQKEILIDILNKNKNKNIILTPHPKECSKMFKILNLVTLSVDEIQSDRTETVRIFSKIYPECVLVLKGANTIIAHKNRYYVSPFGNSCLSKGGSGDVLAGLIGSLLAQGYTPLDATISGVIAHGLSGENYTKNSYSLTPQDIIEGVKCL